MKETLKNFIAMVVATTIWMLGFSVLFGAFFLFESGPQIEEVVFLVVVIILFSGGVYVSKKNKRLKTALEFPLFPRT